MQRLEQGESFNPFFDPSGYRRFIEGTEQAYREQLQKQQGETIR